MGKTAFIDEPKAPLSSLLSFHLGLGTTSIPGSPKSHLPSIYLFMPSSKQRGIECFFTFRLGQGFDSRPSDTVASTYLNKKLMGKPYELGIRLYMVFIPDILDEDYYPVFHQ